MQRTINQKLRKARQLVMSTNKPHQVAILHKLIDIYKKELISKTSINSYHPFYACE